MYAQFDIFEVFKFVLPWLRIICILQLVCLPYFFDNFCQTNAGFNVSMIILNTEYDNIEKEKKFFSSEIL